MLVSKSEAHIECQNKTFRAQKRILHRNECEQKNRLILDACVNELANEHTSQLAATILKIKSGNSFSFPEGWGK